MKSDHPTTLQEAIEGLESACEGLKVATKYCDVFEIDTSSREDYKTEGKPPENVANLDKAHRQLGNHYSQGPEFVKLGDAVTNALKYTTEALEVAKTLTYRNQ